MAVIDINGVQVEIAEDELSKAVESGKLEIKTNLVTYKPEDFETFKTNLANDEYKKGRTAGEEMTVKALKQKAGIEIEGKDPDKFLEVFKSNVLEQAKIEPSKKIEELTKDNENLRKTYGELETTFNTFKTEITQKETRAKRDSELLKVLPLEGLKVKQADALDLMKLRGFDVDYDESGKLIPLKNGKVVKDEKLSQPIDIKTFAENALKSLDLFDKPQGGRGESDSDGKDKPGSFEAFTKEMKNKGVEDTSIDFKEEMQKRIMSGTLSV